MKVNLYALKDKKSEMYHPPMVSVNHETMKRQLRIAHEDTMVSKYSEDFSLFQVGTYDDSTGVIKEAIPRFINTMTIVLRGPEKPEKE